MARSADVGLPLAVLVVRGSCMRGCARSLVDLDGQPRCHVLSSTHSVHRRRRAVQSADCKLRKTASLSRSSRRSAVSIELCRCHAIESIQVDEGQGVGTFAVWGLVLVAMPPLLAFWPRRPATALAWGSAACATLALLTLPLYGLGVVFIPLAVSYALAAKNARRPSADLS